MKINSLRLLTVLAFLVNLNLMRPIRQKSIRNHLDVIRNRIRGEY